MHLCSFICSFHRFIKEMKMKITAGAHAKSHVLKQAVFERKRREILLNKALAAKFAGESTKSKLGQVINNEKGRQGGSIRHCLFLKLALSTENTRVFTKLIGLPSLLVAIKAPTVPEKAKSASFVCPLKLRRTNF
jgi:hypothetical protein